ncbi:hypothetical protein [Candidatus Thioglobus sp.]|jgi:hypothetical protein|uniref:hypothetical protein n=1 Tax=Candidatus Thioglobus sp. TaxID=2026721 RepID=UPI001D98BD97|nr:hypothetical protein [Candidatus Thioglobus sp.]MBT3276574.1 hypothetical protein [Candidatus Thioglobus sp.]MBT4181786.1 hypothetical protein [Candidatus Thioglobus sp.]MBT4421885.1 hypothetical protein [Candidatus Thioglobus sp.]MBT4747261.1 hypothetical protein [Candidatus Thioglobus sp.]MBT5164626.1 hypothetical protein [Candidatus Thioglobus sp.]
MKERHIVGYTLLGAILAFVAIFLFTRDVEMPKNQAMPWQSYINENQQTVVFNLTMAESRLIDAARQFGTEINASLFESELEKPELEVYFSSTKVGGISARIILNLILDEQIIESLSNNIDESMQMPSGVKNTTFTSAGERSMSRLKIKSLTFIPGANLDKEVIENLFGKPARVELATEGVSYWHYPQKGLRIIVDREQKEVLEFFNQ